jgi:hypothetical protein
MPIIVLMAAMMTVKTIMAIRTTAAKERVKQRDMARIKVRELKNP